MLLLNLPEYFCHHRFKEWCFIRCLRYFIHMTSFVFPIFLGVDKKESRQVKKQVYSPHYTDEETDMRKEMDFHSFISFFIHQLFIESHEVLGSASRCYGYSNCLGPSSHGVFSLTYCCFQNASLTMWHLCLNYF